MKPLIVANWKCNPPTWQEAKELFNSIKKGVENIKKAEVVICPPFVYLSRLPVTGSRLQLGAQDCFWGKGAFTGEISPLMLKNLGCQYVIIGHSERRKLGETDEMINKKIKAAISAQLKSILCIGETKKERKSGKTFEILKNQLKNDLKHLIPNTSGTRRAGVKPLIIAYEPIWAIGTGNPCQPEEAKKVLLFLKKILKQTSILYGGSVNSENALSYVKDYNPPTTLPSKRRAPANFNGLLVGGASLDAQEFIKIVRKIAED